MSHNIVLQGQRLGSWISNEQNNASSSLSNLTFAWSFKNDNCLIVLFFDMVIFSFPIKYASETLELNT